MPELSRLRRLRCPPPPSEHPGESATMLRILTYRPYLNLRLWSVFKLHVSDRFSKGSRTHPVTDGPSLSYPASEASETIFGLKATEMLIAPGRPPPSSSSLRSIIPPLNLRVKRSSDPPGSQPSLYPFRYLQITWQPFSPQTRNACASNWTIGEKSTLHSK